MSQVNVVVEIMVSRPWSKTQSIGSPLTLKVCRVSLIARRGARYVAQRRARVDSRCKRGNAKLISPHHVRCSSVLADGWVEGHIHSSAATAFISIAFRLCQILVRLPWFAHRTLYDDLLEDNVDHLPELTLDP